MKTIVAPCAKEVISVSGLWAGYEDEVVLEDINLTLMPLDFVGLIGPNGGGKTTLLKVLVGLLTPLRGAVRIMGHPVAVGRPHIGYVPQVLHADRMFPISVRDVVYMGRLGRRGILRRYDSTDSDAVDATLRDLDLLDLRHRPFGDLSGGQRQRTLIARALAAEPSLLLLDEPTASVDLRVREHVYDLLARLNERITILLVTHDMGVISSYVKTVGCLNRRLHYHGQRELTPQMMEDAYHCAIDLIAHGVPHRVLSEHEGAHSHIDTEAAGHRHV
jgi:zinc transport system ATP-binding protein